jgi:hypothetical protein
MSIRSTRSNSSLLNLESLTQPHNSSCTIMLPIPDESNDTPSPDNPKFLRLEFSDFSDLQTRLVLLPRVEDEGRGAVLSSYSQQQQPSSPVPEQNTAEPSKEHRDDQETSIMAGSVFVGLESKQEDWREKDFTDILASLRQETAPLALLFTTPESPVESDTNTNSNTADQSTTAEPTQSESSSSNTTTTPQQQDSLQSGILALSSWGMRFRAQAGEAANTAATAVASAAKERAKKLQQPKATADGALHPEARPCDMFLQTSVGAFLPVSLSQSKVTTSTLLLIRTSATEPCPPRGWSFEWYRSSSAKSESWEDSASSGSSACSSRANTERGTATCTTTEDLEWVALEGAVHAAFQPDATLIGRRLRCIVTMEPDEPNSDDSSEDLEDVDLNSVEHPQIICELPSVVSADLTLFNGARQALGRGARFGGFRGRGNAANRQFCVEVSIGMSRKRRKPIAMSSLQIYQVQGQDSVKLGPVVLQASAVAPAAYAKHLDLIFPVTPDSMLSALVTDGSFQLEAPNRLTRESFLLALGIANYPGTPAQLDAQTILFREEPRSLLDDDASMSSASCASSVQSAYSSHRSVSSVPQSPTGSLPSAPTTPMKVGDHAEEDRVASLEKELEFVRTKLTRKDKVVSELQRQVAKSDSVYQLTKQSLSTCQQELKHSRNGAENLSQSLKKAERYIKSHEAKVLRLEGDHALHISSLENRIMTQSEKIADLEKANRSLQNEKAVVQAAVEVRESKLVRMGELQTSFTELSERVVQHDAVRGQLETSNKRYSEIQQDLIKVEQLEQECRSELGGAKDQIDQLAARIQEEQDKATSCHSQLDTLQKKNQQLKGERNNFKQKNDSLSKEISRLCRNGRSIKDIEKTMADHKALLEETETLRKQKRQALEDVHLYRTSYEQSKVAQQLAGVDYDTRKALERNAEMERLLAETTEYLSAKEMQLETMKQVNEHLQTEIHVLARANLDKNEV